MLYDSFGGPLQFGVVLVGPPKQDRKQSIKSKKKIGPSVFTLIFWVCPFVALSRFSDAPLHLTNYSIKFIYMHITRTSSIRRLKLCTLFVVSTYISCVSAKILENGEDENLKFKIYEANDISSCRV